MADLVVDKFNVPRHGVIDVRDTIARTEIRNIKDVIPEGVSSDNPLASQEYVDVAVATNSARYIYYTNPSTGETGPFPSLAALEAYSGEVDNNDYAFVLGRDDNGKPVYSRYKYVVDPEASGDEGSWVLEYVMPMPTSAADVGAADMRALAPLFEEHKPYAVGTLVSYKGLMYRCTEGITGTSNERTPDTDTDHWDEIPVSAALEMVVDEIPQPSDDDSDVEMDGEASAGSADTWSRSDHRHPHDTTKFNSDSASPAFLPRESYDAGLYCTYDGTLYECVVALSAPAEGATDNPVPPDDIYNGTTGHWKKTNMTSPDATLDITATGFLRVVGADGTMLWQQGYDKISPITTDESSLTLSNKAEGGFRFQQDATNTVTLVLPTSPLGKVGDFAFEVQNPPLGTEFSDTATYDVGDRVIHNGAVYTCSVAVTTAGAWTDTANWALLYAAYDASTTEGYALGAKVVQDGKLWICIKTIADGSAAGNFNQAHWTTAGFEISGLPDTVRMVVPVGGNLTEILTIGAGIYAQLTFTQTSFLVDGKPTWKVVRQDCEVVPEVVA